MMMWWMNLICAEAAQRQAYYTYANTLLTALQEVEGAMTEGHPGFVANNGRVGLGLTDRHHYTPESRSTVRLVWLAARRDLSLPAMLDKLATGDHLVADADLDPVRRVLVQRQHVLGPGVEGIDHLGGFGQSLAIDARAILRVERQFGDAHDRVEDRRDCQTAFKRDPRSASKRDPFSDMMLVC